MANKIRKSEELNTRVAKVTRRSHSFRFRTTIGGHAWHDVTY